MRPERPLPSSVDTERLVLGAAMLDFESAVCVVDGLGPEDFTLESHRQIFVTLQALQSRGESIDRATVAQELRKHRKLESVGGMAYLVDLDNELPKIYNLDGYVEIIREQTRLRSLLVAAASIESQVYGGSRSAEIVDAAQLGLSGAITDSRSSSLLSFSEVLTREGGQQRFLTPELGMQSPWSRLNFLMPRGIRGGDLVIVGARPSVGKTAFACQWSTWAAATQIGVAMFSLEMGDAETYRRALANVADVDMTTLFTGKMDKPERAKVTAGVHALSELPFWISESMKVTVTEMARSVKRARSAGRNVGLVVIDYLQLMKASRGRANTNEEVSDISRSLKIAARELNCPFVVLSQLSRKLEAEDREPRLSDLRDSGSIEQDADVVMFLHRSAKEIEESRKSGTMGPLKVILAKQRQGPTGAAHLQFNAPKMRLEDTAA